LFSIVLIDQISVTQIQVLDSFNSGPLGYNATVNVSRLPFYTAQAMHNFDMVPPFGLAKDFAYQTFGHIAGRDTSKGTNQRASANRPLTTVVDAVFVNITCLDLESWSEYKEEGVFGRLREANVTLYFEDCPKTPIYANKSFSSTIPSGRDQGGLGMEFWELGFKITHDNGRPCSKLPQQHEQFVYWSPRTAGSGGPGAPLSKVAGVVCSPSTWLSKVRVADDGTSPNATLLREGDAGYVQPVPVETNTWDMIVESIFTKGDSWTLITGDGTTAEGPIFTTYIFMGIEPGGGSGIFRSNEMMRESITNLTSFIGPAVAHTILREDKRSETWGYSTETVERLLISTRPGAAIIVLLLLSSVSAFWILMRFMLSRPMWWRNPATILGTMAILSDADENEWRALKTDWQDSNYTHMPLRSWARCAFVLYGMGLIVGLLVSLDASEQNDGLATIDQNSQKSGTILWKSIPAFAMVCVALYSSSCDALTRSLALFSKLSSSFSERKESNASILGMSLLDMLGLRALYYSIFLGLPAVSIMQVLAMLCGFLTVLSSVLVEVETVPKATEMTVLPRGWFSEPDRYNDTRFWRDKTLGALVLMQGVSNLTYPRHTWGDLVLSTILVDDQEIKAAGGTPGEGTVIEIAISAARLAPRCERASDTVVKDRDHLENMSHPAPPGANITQSLTCLNGTVLKHSETRSLISSIDEEIHNENEKGD
jgi:hypothetical protein